MPISDLKSVPKILSIHMNSNFNHGLRGPSGPFNYNTHKVDFEFFIYFIGPVVCIIAIMAAVILVHPEWVKKKTQISPYRATSN